MQEMMRNYLDGVMAGHKKYHRIVLFLLVLSVFVGLSVFWRLKITGVAMTDEAVCGHTEHTHTEECYERQLVCGLAESEIPHTHSVELGCYEVTKTLTCTAEEHTHGEDCYEYTTEQTCGCEEHTHAEDCYEYTTEQTCGLEEHTHSDECYDADGNLICGLEEHTHSDDCYTEVATLVCGLEEHAHSDDCYTEVATLVCGLEEHTHADGCYTAEVGELICQMEEGATHTHTEECYGDVLVCDLEEHTHTTDCYCDTTADLESGSDWEATLPDTTGVWADDMVAIANSQLGYAESTRNFQLDGSEERGYTRYGEWYGNPYGSWDAMFVSFCMYYSDITSADIPYGAGAYAWSVALQNAGLWADETHTPEPGDVVFLDTDDTTEGPEAVGVVTAVSGDTMTVVAGDYNNIVAQLTGSVSSGAVYGYCPVASLQATREGTEGESYVYTETAEAEEETTSKIVFMEEDDSLITTEEEEEVVTDAEETEEASGEIDETASEEIETVEETEPVTYAHCQNAETENYLVTVYYNDDAQIPEDAVLTATEYAEDSEEFQACVEEAGYQLDWVMDIGFYQAGEKVEPVTSVRVVVTSRDGSSVGETITHFAESGTEVLTGTEDDGAVTFVTNSFSSFAASKVLNNIYGGGNGTNAVADNSVTIAAGSSGTVTVDSWYSNSELYVATKSGNGMNATYEEASGFTVSDSGTSRTIAVASSVKEGTYYLVYESSGMWTSYTELYKITVTNSSTSGGSGSVTVRTGSSATLSSVNVGSTAVTGWKVCDANENEVTGVTVTAALDSSAGTYTLTVAAESSATAGTYTVYYTTDGENYTASNYTVIVKTPATLSSNATVKHIDVKAAAAVSYTNDTADSGATVTGISYVTVTTDADGNEIKTTNSDTIAYQSDYTNGWTQYSYNGGASTGTNSEWSKKTAGSQLCSDVSTLKITFTATLSDKKSYTVTFDSTSTYPANTYYNPSSSSQAYTNLYKMGYTYVSGRGFDISGENVFFISAAACDMATADSSGLTSTLGLDLVLNARTIIENAEIKAKVTKTWTGGAPTGYTLSITLVGLDASGNEVALAETYTAELDGTVDTGTTPIGTTGATYQETAAWTVTFDGINLKAADGSTTVTGLTASEVVKTSAGEDVTGSYTASITGDATGEEESSSSKSEDGTTVTTKVVTTYDDITITNTLAQTTADSGQIRVKKTFLYGSKSDTFAITVNEKEYTADLDTDTTDQVYTWAYTATENLNGTYTIKESGIGGDYATQITVNGTTEIKDSSTTEYETTTTAQDSKMKVALTDTTWQTYNGGKTGVTVSDATIIVAKATDGYYVWTRDTLYANQREKVYAAINEVDGASAATAENTVFYSGSSATTGITCNGGSIQYTSDTLTLEGNAWSGYMTGTYEIPDNDPCEIEITNAYVELVKVDFFLNLASQNLDGTTVTQQNMNSFTRSVAGHYTNDSNNNWGQSMDGTNSPYDDLYVVEPAGWHDIENSSSTILHSQETWNFGTKSNGETITQYGAISGATDTANSLIRNLGTGQAGNGDYSQNYTFQIVDSSYQSAFPTDAQVFKYLAYNWSDTDESKVNCAKAITVTYYTSSSDTTGVTITIKKGTMSDSEFETYLNNNFEIKWYVFKDDQYFWHVDGLLVAKTSTLTIQKTFPSVKVAQAALAKGYSVTLTGGVLKDANGDDVVLTYALESSDIKAGATGAVTYTLETNIPIFAGEYTVTENNYDGLTGYTYTSTTNDLTVDTGRVTHTDTGSTGYENTALTFTSTSDGTRKHYTASFTNNYETNIKLLKVASGNGTGLSGAKFTLTNSKNEYLTKASDGTYSWGDTEAELESVTGGIIYLGSLPDGIYTLTETKAPDGYNLLANSITITVSEGSIKATDGQSTGSVVSTTSETGYAAFKISNNAGNELPHTGGSGILPYTIAGLALMLTGLGGMAIRRRKRRAEG